MITKIDHIGIAVTRLKDRLPFWAEALGLEVAAIESVETEKVRVAFLPTADSTIELLEPTDESSTIARYLSKRGEGMHHLTFAVDDLEGMLARLAEREVAVLGGGARPGAGGQPVAFLDPKGTGGVLIELVERGELGGGPTPDIRPGSTVLLYMRDPQEKLWGMLRRLDTAGVVLEGIDLSSFDDWIAQVDRGEESVVGPSVLFVPMTRIERILLDRPSGHIPSLADRFERRTGRTVGEVLADLDPDPD